MSDWSVLMRLRRGLRYSGNGGTSDDDLELVYW